MMGSNLILFGWNRSIPGREKLSAQHFDEFVQYLGGQQKSGKIQSFEVVFLDGHGGDMNGFFLIRADTAKLDALTASADWVGHMTRATLHLENSGAVRGVTGDTVTERMKLWKSHLPA